MKAGERILKQILYTGDQYIIPLFQRYYEWKETHWERLWEDIIAMLEEETRKECHFLGSIVCIPNKPEPGKLLQYIVIDGQQRVITLSLILCVLRDVAQAMGKQEMAETIQDYYLMHRHGKALDQFKVIPRQRDRKSYFELISRSQLSDDTNIIRAYKYFQTRVQEFITEHPSNGLDLLLGATTDQLMLVVITLDNENPFEIFKSLNSTGMKLAEADLIRNHVFMQIPLSEQEAFDEEYWLPLERKFEKTEILPAIDITDFFRDYLMRNGIYVRPNQTFVAFENDYDIPNIQPETVCKELYNYADHFNVIRGRKRAATNELDTALRILRSLSVSTSYPLVLNLMERQRTGTMSTDDLVKCVRAILGFVMRRYICGESSRAYSRWFPLACRNLGDSPLNNLYSYLKDKGWPDDSRFITSLVKFNLYSSNYGREVLEALQANVRTTEPVDVSQCTIEHILPQWIHGDDEDNLAWQEALSGDEQDWRSVWATWVHTIGNLTLVGYDYNTSMSNKHFQEKKNELARSKVDLNRYFDKLSSWDAAAIEKRGIELAQACSRIWAEPNA